MTNINNGSMSHHASTKIDVANPEAIQSVLLQELSEFGEVLHHDETRLTMRVDIGIIDNVIKHQSMEISIQCDSSANLHMLRESVNHYAEDHMHLPSLTWSDEASIQAGTLPPNCKIATVVDARWLSNSFIRVTVEAEKLDSYTHTALHFRIGLPKQGQTPVWPHLSPKGKTVWPKGVDKLHTPAYTTVAVDLDTSQLTFDVYAHNQGDTCAWATGLVTKTDPRKTILLSGPGGLWLPPSSKLIIAGDETALPAIRRTLEAAKPDDNILAFIEMATPEDFDNAVDSIKHQATLLARSEGLSAKQALINLADSARENCYIWFAGEKSDAATLRQLAKTSWNISSDRKYIAGYWTRDDSKKHKELSS